MKDQFEDIFEEFMPSFGDLFRDLFSDDKRKERRINYKLQVIENYGGKCSCCGERNWQFLTVDHINGGGRKHRREIRTNIYRWLIMHHYPADFRVLCLNCHMSISFYGYCPHKSLFRGRYVLAPRELEATLP